MAVQAEKHTTVVVGNEPRKVVAPGQDSNYRLARRVTYYSLDVVEVLLAARFLLKAFGANVESLFVQFIYAASGALALPFQGIFPNTAAASGIVFEWSTLVAMGAYLLIAMGLVRLFKLIIKGGRAAQDETLER